MSESVSPADDPQQLTGEQAVAVMEESGGYLCLVIDGVGLGTYFRYNPSRGAFELLEKASTPSRSEDGRVGVDDTTATYRILSKEATESELALLFDQGLLVDSLPYPQSPFPTESTLPEITDDRVE